MSSAKTVPFPKSLSNSFEHENQEPSPSHRSDPDPFFDIYAESFQSSGSLSKPPAVNPFDSLTITESSTCDHSPLENKNNLATPIASNVRTLKTPTSGVQQTSRGFEDRNETPQRNIVVLTRNDRCHSLESPRLANDVFSPVTTTGNLFSTVVTAADNPFDNIVSTKERRPSLVVMNNPFDIIVDDQAPSFSSRRPAPLSSRGNSIESIGLHSTSTSSSSTTFSVMTQERPESGSVPVNPFDCPTFVPRVSATQVGVIAQDITTPNTTSHEEFSVQLPESISNSSLPRPSAEKKITETPVRMATPAKANPMVATEPTVLPCTPLEIVPGSSSHSRTGSESVNIKTPTRTPSDISGSSQLLPLQCLDKTPNATSVISSRNRTPLVQPPIRTPLVPPGSCSLSRQGPDRTPSQTPLVPPGSESLPLPRSGRTANRTPLVPSGGRNTSLPRRSLEKSASTTPLVQHVSASGTTPNRISSILPRSGSRKISTSEIRFIKSQTTPDRVSSHAIERAQKADRRYDKHLTPEDPYIVSSVDKSEKRNKSYAESSQSRSESVQPTQHEAGESTDTQSPPSHPSSSTKYTSSSNRTMIWNRRPSDPFSSNKNNISNCNNNTTATRASFSARDDNDIQDDEVYRVQHMADSEIVLRSCEIEPTLHQIDLPSAEDFLLHARVCALMESYDLFVEARGGAEHTFDFGDLVGLTRDELETSYGTNNSSSNKNNNSSPLLLDESMNAINSRVGKGVSPHPSIVKSLLECAEDLVVEGFFRTKTDESTGALSASSKEEVKDGQVEVTVFSSQKHRQFVVCYRGSIEQQTKPLKSKSKIQLGGSDCVLHPAHPVSVHPTFKKAYFTKTLENDVFGLLNDLVGSHPFCDVVFTGHSFGAALGTLAATRFAAFFPMITVSCHLFGAPKVGGIAFRHLTNSLPNLKGMRVEHGADPYVHLPSDGKQWMHVGHTITIEAMVWSSCGGYGSSGGNSSNNSGTGCLSLKSMASSISSRSPKVMPKNAGSCDNNISGNSAKHDGKNDNNHRSGSGRTSSSTTSVRTDTGNSAGGGGGGGVLAYRFDEKRPEQNFFRKKKMSTSTKRKANGKRDHEIRSYVHALERFTHLGLPWVRAFVGEEGEGVSGKNNEVRCVV